MSAILFCHHLCKPKQIVKKPQQVSAHIDMNHSPERLYENLIAGPKRQRERKKRRDKRAVTIHSIPAGLSPPSTWQCQGNTVHYHWSHLTSHSCRHTKEVTHIHSTEYPLSTLAWTDVWSICTLWNWNLLPFISSQFSYFTVYQVSPLLGIGKTEQDYIVAVTLTPRFVGLIVCNGLLPCNLPIAMQFAQLQ